LEGSLSLKSCPEYPWGATSSLIFRHANEGTGGDENWHTLLKFQGGLDNYVPLEGNPVS